MSTAFSKKLSCRLGAFFVSARALHKVKGGHFCFGEVLLDLDFSLAVDVVKHVIHHRKPVFCRERIFYNRLGSSAENVIWQAEYIRYAEKGLKIYENPEFLA